MTARSIKEVTGVDVRLSSGPSKKYQVWLFYKDGSSSMHSLHPTRIEAEREGMRVSKAALGDAETNTIRLEDVRVDEVVGDAQWHVKLVYSDDSTRLQGIYPRQAEAEFAAQNLKRNILEMGHNHFFNGKRVVVTGRMNKTRPEIERDLANVGAIVQKAVGRNTDYLICGADVGETKTRAAEGYGVKMLNRDDYRNAMSSVAAQVESVVPKMTHDEFVASLPETYGDF